MLLLGFKAFGENHTRYDQAKEYFEKHPNPQPQRVERDERVAPPVNDEDFRRKF